MNFTCENVWSISHVHNFIFTFYLVMVLYQMHRHDNNLKYLCQHFQCNFLITIMWLCILKMKLISIHMWNTQLWLYYQIFKFSDYIISLNKKKV
jgi:hypothetical protein